MPKPACRTRDSRDEDGVLNRVAQAPEPDPAERQTHLVDERGRDVERNGQHDEEAREGVEAVRVDESQDRGDECRHTAHTDPPAGRADGERARKTWSIGDGNSGDEARQPGGTSEGRRGGGQGHERQRDGKAAVVGRPQQPRHEREEQDERDRLERLADPADEHGRPHHGAWSSSRSRAVWRPRSWTTSAASELPGRTRRSGKRPPLASSASRSASACSSPFGKRSPLTPG